MRFFRCSQAKSPVSPLFLPFFKTDFRWPQGAVVLPFRFDRWGSLLCDGFCGLSAGLGLQRDHGGHRCPGGVELEFERRREVEVGSLRGSRRVFLITLEGVCWVGLGLVGVGCWLGVGELGWVSWVG